MSLGHAQTNNSGGPCPPCGVWGGRQCCLPRHPMPLGAPLSCTKYVWYCGHRDHISCILKTEELFQEHFYWLKAPGGRLQMSFHAQVTTNLRRTQMPMTWLSSNITTRCTTSTSSNLISSQHLHCHAPNVFGTVVIGVGNYRGMGNPQGSGVRVLRGTGCLFCTPVPLGHNPWYPWADYFELDYVLQLSTFTNDNSHLTTLYHHLNQPCHHYNTWRWWIVISSGEWQWRQGWIVAETANTVNAMSLTPVACPTDRYVYFILLFHFLPLLTGPLHHTPQPPVLCSCFYMYVFLFFICDDPTAASMM